MAGVASVAITDRNGQLTRTNGNGFPYNKCCFECRVAIKDLWIKSWRGEGMRERPSFIHFTKLTGTIGLCLFLPSLINSRVCLLLETIGSVFRQDFISWHETWNSYFYRKLPVYFLMNGWPSEGLEQTSHNDRSPILTSLCGSECAVSHGMEYDLLSTNRPQTRTRSSWYESR